MNKINLPPLPDEVMLGTDSCRIGIFGYTPEQFRAGQIAAVEKDRAERGGVPDGWQLVPKACLPEIREAIAAATGNGYGTK